MKSCSICKRVTSKLKPIKCSCGKITKVGHFQVIVDWHVYCDCGIDGGDYNTYHQAVSQWNKTMKKSSKKTA